MKIKVNLFSKSSLTLLICLALSSFAFAQKTITGTVTSTSGEALVGATVVVTGTTNGTATDVDGKYSLSVGKDAKSLTISYTGYGTQVIALGAGNVYDAKLSAGQELTAVTIVSTGYGKLKAKEVSSAIVNVRAEDFNQGAINDPNALLQGKVAGLEVSRSGSNPNQNFTVILRGISTAIGSPAPLVVIDGIPNLDINLIDPNDIQSVDVLKDGSASAIYGTRGSNGVLLVTTKKGKTDAPKIEFNTQATTESIYNSTPVMTGAQFVAAGGTNLGSNTNWLNAITRQAFSTVNNLGISGGAGENTSYRASLNYRDIQGVALNDGYRNLNGLFAITQKALDNKLTITGLAIMSNKDQDIGQYDAFRYATSTNPTQPIYDASANGVKYGGYYEIPGIFDGFNPVSIVNQNTAKQTTNNTLYSAKADLELLPGLTIGGIYSKNTSNNIFYNYSNKTSVYGGGINRNGLATQATNTFNSNYFNGNINYSVNLDTKTKLSLLGGYDYQIQNYAGNYMQAGNFFVDNYGYNGIFSAGDIANGMATLGSYAGSNTVISFFGRANLSYDDTYNVMASIRRDGSTRFGANNKWGLFPAVSASANLAKLLAIQNVELLKLRVGYGVTGALPPNDGISQSTVGQQSGQFLYNGSYTPVYGPTQNANPNLKWEVKKELNVGVDFSITHNLSGSIDYYNRNVSDLLYNYAVPATTYLYSTLTANVGTLESSGLEFTLNYKAIKTADFEWTTSPNFTYNISDKIVSLSQGALQFGSGGVLYTANAGSPGLNGTNYERLAEGQPIGQFWGYKYAGLNAAGQVLGYKADGSTTQIVNLSPAKDGQVLGHGLPDFALGWTNSFKYGNFDFSFYIRGAFGYQIINENRVFYENESPTQLSNYNITMTKYFNPAQKESQFTSNDVENGSFIKLQNATLGYTFAMPKGGAISKLRAYVSGNNLFTVTGYTGVDPEPHYYDVGSIGAALGASPLTPGSTTVAGSTQGNYLLPGIDRRSNYFVTRSFSAGLQVTF